MSLNKRQFFSGNTVEQAVLAAACHYHVDPDRIAYRQVDKRHGFVKMRRRLVIEVDPDNPLRPETKTAGAAPGGEPRRERPLPTPRPPAPEGRREAAGGHRGGGRREREDRGRGGGRREREDRGREETRPEGERPAPGPPREAPSQEQILAAAREAAERVLRLGKLDLQAAVSWGDERVEIDLTGPDRERLLDEEGEVLQAIEYLVPRVMRGLVGDAATCRVDSGGFRRGREEELVELARRTADAVRQGGRPIVLEPMNPTERRVVHMALAEEPDVTTESEGDGYFKQVAVKLV
jgi:spoIIIJ-associated protein